MGWAVLIALAAFAGALLLLLRFPARLWMVAATALTLGAAGYAWQGTPGLRGHPVEPAATEVQVDPSLVMMREAMFGRFNQSYAYFAIADAMTRSGDKHAAAQAMIGAVTKAPTDAALWTWLGITTAQNDGGLSPAARFAFDRAIALAPTHPGPEYFLGLALAGGGQYLEARRHWARAVELTPEKMEYRAALAGQLARLDQFIAANAPPAASGDGTAPPAP